MSLHSLAGLLILTYIAHIAAGVPVTSSAILVSNLASETGLSSARFLRTISSDSGSEEERGRETLSVSVADKIKSVLMSPDIAPEKLQKWLAEAKPADAVFTRLGLTKVKYGLIAQPKFAQWLKYVDELNAKSPTKGTPAISTLTTQYGDAGMYQKIQRAKLGGGPEEKTIAARLQKEQVQHWLANAQQPDDIFHIMKLDNRKYNLLHDDEFVAWVKYVDDFNAKYSEVPVSMASTITKYQSGGVFFQEAEAAKSIGKTTEAIATKLQDDLITYWVKNEKTPEDTLEAIGLGKTAGIIYSTGRPQRTVLEKPVFQSWTKYVDAYNVKYPEEKTTMIEVLTRTYGDARVARMLDVAMKEDKTRNLATALESAQLKRWSDSGESVNDVYKLLKFDREDLVGDFATSPLRIWVAYMDFTMKKSTDEATSLLASLKTRFLERPLNQLLLEAKKFPSMESAALAMQTAELQSYLVKNESPYKIFKLLALDNVGDSLLSDPLFLKWMKYTQDFNRKNPKRQESWFKTVAWLHNPDPVKRMIETALQNPHTVRIAELAKRERFKYWLESKKLPKYSFRDLDLHKPAENTLLASAEFKAWSKYLSDFNRRYPEEKTTMIDALEYSYHNSELVKILAAAKKDPRAEKLATNLQSALINKWMAAQKKPADLKRMLHDGPASDEMVKRYSEKLEALGNMA